LFFRFKVPASSEIYTLSLHDALPIFRTFVRASRATCWIVWSERAVSQHRVHPERDLFLRHVRKDFAVADCAWKHHHPAVAGVLRSEEHTSELQSRGHLVCRLLLEKKQ